MEKQHILRVRKFLLLDEKKTRKKIFETRYEPSVFLNYLLYTTSKEDFIDISLDSIQAHVDTFLAHYRFPSQYTPEELLHPVVTKYSPWQRATFVSLLYYFGTNWERPIWMSTLANTVYTDSPVFLRTLKQNNVLYTVTDGKIAINIVKQNDEDTTDAIHTTEQNNPT